MRSKTVIHHYCDFCNKVKHTRPAMERHEASCTANPNRVCKMCRMAELEQKPQSAIYAATMGATSSEEYEAKAREAVSNCPACLLAFERQRINSMGDEDRYSSLFFEVKWKEESAAWLAKYGLKNFEDYY